MKPITLLLKIRTVSEANSHTHWRKRHARAKVQRNLAGMMVGQQVGWHVALKDPVVVTLTRIAPRALDSDNLAGSGKHIRDGIADGLGIDDRDPIVEWRYAQRRGQPGEYAVEVRIEDVAVEKQTGT